jgi:hypothetical protein
MLVPGLLAKAKMAAKVIRAANILTGFVSPTTGCCFPAEAN